MIAHDEHVIDIGLIEVPIVSVGNLEGVEVVGGRRVGIHTHIDPPKRTITAVLEVVGHTRRTHTDGRKLGAIIRGGDNSILDIRVRVQDAHTFEGFGEGETHSTRSGLLPELITRGAGVPENSRLRLSLELPITRKTALSTREFRTIHVGNLGRRELAGPERHLADLAGKRIHRGGTIRKCTADLLDLSADPVRRGQGSTTVFDKCAIDVQRKPHSLIGGNHHVCVGRGGKCMRMGEQGIQKVAACVDQHRNTVRSDHDDGAAGIRMVAVCKYKNVRGTWERRKFSRTALCHDRGGGVGHDPELPGEFANGVGNIVSRCAYNHVLIEFKSLESVGVLTDLGGRGCSGRCSCG